MTETRVYRGPNYWSYDPAITLIVDLGVLEAFPSNTIPGFVDGLLELMPAVGQHSCSTGRPRMPAGRCGCGCPGWNRACPGSAWIRPRRLPRKHRPPGKGHRVNPWVDWAVNPESHRRADALPAGHEAR